MEIDFRAHGSGREGGEYFEGIALFAFNVIISKIKKNEMPIMFVNRVMIFTY
jgi:hypothetical protein